jgi:hypothetical protein
LEPLWTLRQPLPGGNKILPLPLRTVKRSGKRASKLGRNSYRNLVSCCHDCNTKKKDRSADEFLRWLYRERRLGADELARRVRALDDLAAGKLKPPLPGHRDTHKYD